MSLYSIRNQTPVRFGFGHNVVDITIDVYTLSSFSFVLDDVETGKL